MASRNSEIVVSKTDPIEDQVEDEKKVLNLKPSQISQRYFTLEGDWFSLQNRDYLLPIYDGNFDKLLIKAARQTEKSTTVCNKQIITSMVNDNHSTLYVSPSMTQTQRFSNNRLSKRIKRSPYINRFFYQNVDVKNVFEKHLANGSVMWLSYAGTDADRIRGISADEVYIDEIQDIIKDNIPIIEEVMSHTENPHSMYTGTPKTKQNTIEKFWNRSTQHEWVVKCRGCNNYNILGYQNIGKKGPVCAKCGKRIYPTQDGQWQWMRDPNKCKVFGFRITQLMVPWIVQSDRKWDDLLYKIENDYSPKEIYNEVLGLPYSTADHPIKKEHLVACCGSYEIIEKPDAAIRDNPCFAGIDIGTGEAGELGDDATSYTTLTIMRRDEMQNKKVIFMKRYEGMESDPIEAARDMVKWCNMFNVDLVGIDWGLSQTERSMLRESLGYNRVIPIFYSTIKDRYKWDERQLKLQVNRTETLTETFREIKDEEFLFPKWEESQDYLKDFLAIFSEVDRRGTRQYDHEDEDPDDMVHSVNYANIASKVWYSEQRQELESWEMHA